MNTVTDVNVALCGALGLNPENVHSITIEICPDDLPTVRVVHKMRDSIADTFTSEIETNYKLVPAEAEIVLPPGEVT